MMRYDAGPLGFVIMNRVQQRGIDNAIILSAKSIFAYRVANRPV